MLYQEVEAAAARGETARISQRDYPYCHRRGGHHVRRGLQQGPAAAAAGWGWGPISDTPITRNKIVKM